MIIQWLLVIALWSSTQSDPIPVAGVTRPNYGIDFNFLFQVNNMHGSWKHAWTLDLDILHREMPTIPKIPCNIPGTPLYCQQFQEYLSEGTKILWESTRAFQSVHTWMDDPQLLATLSRGVQRLRKRSLLPFIGDIEKFLFGVATESDLASLKATMDDFTQLDKKVVDQVTQLGDNLASLTKIQNEQLANSQKGFKTIKNTFSNLTSQIDRKFTIITNAANQQSGRIDDVEMAFSDTFVVLTEILRIHSSISSLVLADLQIINGLQQVLMGYIPISLIPPSELVSGLEVALEGSRKVFPQASLSYPSSALGYYYTHQIVTPILEPGSITLIADIPLDLQQQILNVYAVRTFPVPLLPYNPYIHQVQVDSHASTAESILMGQPDYWVIDQQGEYYSTGQHYEIMLCKGSTVKYCPKQFPLFSKHVSHCLQRLWMDATFEDVLAICPYQLAHVVRAVQHIPYVQVTPLSSGSWYVNVPLDDKWTVVCPNRPPEVRNPCTSCIIQVDCGCGVRNKYFTIPTRIASCDQAFSPLSKNYTVNPFSYLPHKTPWVMNMTGSKTHSSPPISVPNIALPDSDNWDDVMQSMDRQKYDLNRLYTKQMNETKMFRSEAEALLVKIQSQDKLISSIAGWPDWIVGLGLGLSFFNTFCLILFCFLSFTRRVGAYPHRFLDEPALVQSDISTTHEEAIISLEAIILVFVILNFVLLCVITGPTIMNWWNNNKWMRKARGILVRIKANHYRQIRSGMNIILEGTGTFVLGAIPRKIRFQILVARVGRTTWLQYDPMTPIEILCESDDFDFIFNIRSQVVLTTEENAGREVKVFSVNRKQLTSALRMSMHATITEFDDVRVLCESN